MFIPPTHEDNLVREYEYKYNAAIIHWKLLIIKLTIQVHIGFYLESIGNFRPTEMVRLFNLSLHKK